MKKVLELIESALAALKQSNVAGNRADSIRAHLESCASNAKASLAEADPPKPKPTSGFTSRALLGIIALLGVLLFAAFHSTRAQDSFGVTNYIASAVDLRSTVPTNASDFKTGGAVSVLNQREAGVYLTATNPTANASTVWLFFKRGFGPTSAAYRQNGSGVNNTLYWESDASLQIDVPVAAGAMVGWSTNLSADYLAGANYLAIARITNSNAGANGLITNVQVGVIKKIIPIRFP
jgi:hypothetical protein